MTSIQQRAALQRQIWQIANDVRESVDHATVAKIDRLRADIDAIVGEIEE
jgi:hypothetical protein